MPHPVVIDELFLTLRVPADLPDADVEAVRRVLAGAAFLPRLRKTVRAVIQSHPELARVRAKVSR
ncbi:MAG TPA: hypothetical protein VM597_11705 [Gemmataceae bacterium]|nr:hypothetical protein [Gemmataceae bacterium]